MEDKELYDRFCQPWQEKIERMVVEIHSKVNNGYEDRIGKLEQGQSRMIGYLVTGFCVILGAVIGLGVWL